MSDDMLMINFDRIDAAWGQKYFYDGVDGPLIRANLVGIVACEECEGMGNYQEIRNFNWTECESCDGHGWIVK